VLGFGAALPLAIWTAVVCHRPGSLGVTVPGAVMGLVGGTLPRTWHRDATTQAAPAASA